MCFKYTQVNEILNVPLGDQAEQAGNESSAHVHECAEADVDLEAERDDQ